MSTEFAPVLPNTGVGNGIIQVLRGGKLITINEGEKSEAPLEAGTTVQGVYTGSTPNKFDNSKSDFSLRAEDGTLIILAQTAALVKQFSKVNPGELVQVTYNGKKTIKRKSGATAEMHDYMVLRAMDVA
jgi:hypothetical protein